MAKFIFSGLEQYAKSLEQVRDETPGILGAAVYEGAGIVADEIRRQIEALPAWKGSPGGKGRGITPAAREGLLDSLGIAKMEVDDGYYSVKIGFDGYNLERTQKYPNGKPNAMIARALESGTSFSVADPFVTRAIKKTRKAAVKKMEETVDGKLKSIVG